MTKVLTTLNLIGLGFIIGVIVAPTEYTVVAPDKDKYVHVDSDETLISATNRICQEFKNDKSLRREYILDHFIKQEEDKLTNWDIKLYDSLKVHSCLGYYQENIV